MGPRDGRLKPGRDEAPRRAPRRVSCWVELAVREDLRKGPFHRRVIAEVPLPHSSTGARPGALRSGATPETLMGCD
jgi:hypothetical protein